MSQPSYLVPCVEITELMSILNVVKYDIFVITFPVYSIIFPPKVRHTRIGSPFYSRTLTTMCKYMAVRPTSILLRATK